MAVYVTQTAVSALICYVRPVIHSIHVRFALRVQRKPQLLMDLAFALTTQSGTTKLTNVENAQTDATSVHLVTFVVSNVPKASMPQHQSHVHVIHAILNVSYV